MSQAAPLSELKSLVATPENPALGPGPRANVQPLPQLIQQVGRVLNQSDTPLPQHDLITALVFLWHDHLDAAHQIAQAVENADGSYVHGIMHRREPDSGNAKYWFRRVGNHDCFPELARRVAALLQSKNGRGLEAKLLPRGQWDAFAFIDACERAAARPAYDAETQLLRAIQATEFEVLLDYLCQK